MNRPPDPDPQRGPRRYGPSGAGDQAGRAPRARGDRPLWPGQEPAPGSPPPGVPQPGRPQPGQPQSRPSGPGPAWSQTPDPLDRTAVYPGLGLDLPPAGRPPQGQPLDPRLRGPQPQVRPPVQRPAGQFPAGYQPAGLPAERQRRTPGAIVAGRIIAGVLSVAVLAGVAFGSIFLKSADDRIPKGPSAAAAGTAGVLFRGGTNILLIGSDARTDQQGNPLNAAELAAVSTQADGGGVNTDTIMIVHIPQGGGKATAVSIPRDTWIPQEVTDEVKGPYDDGTKGTYKPNKINSFYSTAKSYTESYDVKKGGMTAAQREVDSNNAGRTELQAIVQAFTGLRIDHYAEVNLIGFYTLSNAIGGVPVCLNKAVNDPFSGAVFKAGAQEIQGKAAMSFVRQRHGLPGGDLDRVRRQQAFLAGATNKMLSAGVLTSPGKMSNLLDAASRAVVLDSGFDLVTFAEQMSSLSGGNVKFETLPTNGAAAASGTDALGTDPVELKAFFKAIDGSSGTETSTAGTSGAGSTGSGRTTAASTAPATVDPSSVTVDVQNATKINNLAASVSATLVAAGFAAGDVTTFPGVTAANQHATTTISYPAGARAAAQAVQKALRGKGKLVQDDSISTGHVSVAAGQDMPAPSGLRALGGIGFAAGAVGGPVAAGAVAGPVAGSVAGSVGSAAGAAPTTGPAPITAGSVGCVN